MLACSALLMCVVAAEPPLFQGAPGSVFTRRDLGVGTGAPQARLHVSSADGLAVILPGLRLFQNAISPNVVGGSSANEFSKGVVGATIAGGGRAEGGAINRATADYAVVGGGLSNRAGGVKPSQGMFATVGGGEDNEATGQWATIGGGFGNTASGEWATISGGESNTATNIRSTIGGGFSNTASDYGATVGGGAGNFALGRMAVVSGGTNNVASQTNASVGGGSDNSASGWGSTITGGIYNITEGVEAAVGGGSYNVANGHAAMVPGGSMNTAVGDYSFAAGRHAKALHHGAFVWADSANTNFGSTAEDQFLIRATGGVGIGTDAPEHLLSVNGSAGKPGGGAWSVFSDARLKQNIAPLRGVLDRMLRLRGCEFDYTVDALTSGRGLPGRQIGLIAQEVAEVFPDWVEADSAGYLSVTERATTALLVESLRELRAEKDAQLAARDATITRLRAKMDDEIEELRAEKDAEIASMRSEITAMRRCLDRLERSVQQDRARD